MKTTLLLLLAMAWTTGGPQLSAAAPGNPRIENRSITVGCRVKPGAEPDGVLVAQGGQMYGYSVFVQHGRLCFTVRDRAKPTTIRAEQPVPRSAFRVEAVLDQGGQMVLRLDGRQVASGKAGGLISTQPGLGFCIGQDMRSAVGPYALPFAYAGGVSEVIVNGVAMATEFYTPKQDMGGWLSKLETSE